MSTPRSHRLVIEADNPWKPFDLGEVLRYRDMLYFKIVYAYRAEHRQTVLSYLWVVIDPLLKIVFCSLIFGRVAKIDTGSVPYVAFNAAAIVAWTFLGTCLNGAVGSLANESVLLQKIYFPRLFIPLVPCLTQIPNFLLNLVLTLGLLAFLGFWPGWSLLAVVPLLLLMIVQAAGVGLLLSSYAFQFRDVRKLWSGIMQFLIYAVPVAYPLSAIPARFRGWYTLNPMASAIEGFRDALLGLPIPWPWIGLSFAVSLFLFYIGSVVFRLREPLIVDAA